MADFASTVSNPALEWIYLRLSPYNNWIHMEEA